jgi:hypothetical protein
LLKTRTLSWSCANGNQKKVTNSVQQFYRFMWTLMLH